MTASVGLMIFGTSRSSKRTSRGPYRTAPSMIYLLLFHSQEKTETLLLSPSTCGVATIHSECVTDHEACAGAAKPENYRGDLLFNEAANIAATDVAFYAYYAGPI